ncbi:MAG: hypothetical protein NC123_15545 [Butyrivibrio sp.]|nr:hypothetical protein [Acetatifactor muris]MCM1560933.1 hypothetical protein [Butyrivibrio sp.]
MMLKITPIPEGETIQVKPIIAGKEIVEEPIMPEQIRSYIEKEYAKLREKAATYGELNDLIVKECRFFRLQAKEWKTLQRMVFREMYEAEVSSLSIQQAAPKTTTDQL